MHHIQPQPVHKCFCVNYECHAQKQGKELLPLVQCVAARAATTMYSAISEFIFCLVTPYIDCSHFLPPIKVHCNCFWASLMSLIRVTGTKHIILCIADYYKSFQKLNVSFVLILLWCMNNLVLHTVSLIIITGSNLDASIVMCRDYDVSS